MGNNVSENIEGRYVLLQPRWFKASLIAHVNAHPEERVFKAVGGFGCSPDTMGNAVFGEFVVDGEKCRVEGYDLMPRFATDEEVEAAFQERRRRGVPWSKDVRDCDFEFGPTHEHDDMECHRLMDAMSSDAPYDDGLADALNREAEEQSLGRPLFPNEF